MHWIDWTIVSALLIGIVVLAISTKKYTQSVADFLAANRCAGRYLLSISEGMAGLGAITVVAMFEMYYNAGFTGAWWGMMYGPIFIIVALAGYVIYRFRETRALTLAQYFEMRYNKPVRIIAGLLAWLSGIINFGIFPAVGARFFMSFCGIPHMYMNWAEDTPFITSALNLDTVINPTGNPFDLTFILIMIGLLAISLFFVFLGGQIAVMVTDFVQGVFTNIVFLIIIAFIFYTFTWGDIVSTLQTAPEGKSMLNPFDTGKTDGFNPWYYIIGMVGILYAYKSWQGAQAYNASAKNPHEARMAGILGAWRGVILTLVMMLLPIGAWVIMHNAGHTETQEVVNSALATMPSETLAKQMTVPTVLTKAMPVGLIGMFCAVMVFAFISTHDTYLHSWGSIFVQDVILPFKRKPFSPKQHIWILRISIIFVAMFIFAFSLLVPQKDYILMFFALTGAIYVGGAGAVIVFGLYWRRGTSAGAIASLFVGSSTAIIFFCLQQFWAEGIYDFMLANTPNFLEGVTNTIHSIADNVYGINWKVTPEKFPIDGQWVFGFSMIISCTTYIVVSLVDHTITRRPLFNMDQMLHRGEYAVAGDHEDENAAPVSGLKAILPSEEFTFRDKLVYYGNLLWTFGWFFVFWIFSALNFVWGLSDDGWARFWFVQVILAMCLGTFTVIWFICGGIRDMKDLFHTLRTAKRDTRDDGMVVHGHNLADEPEGVETIEDAEALEEPAGMSE
ncbi:sodium:solute symporter family protein [Poriferisphaera sp. WC338]|uniref:sodium:solute symporter family protein n=1 Tax=Poriferisphaera sp. WC338 TaxID=3425129 RepID=UPI003D818FEF